MEEYRKKKEVSLKSIKLATPTTARKLLGDKPMYKVTLYPSQLDLSIEAQKTEEKSFATEKEAKEFTEKYYSDLIEELRNDNKRDYRLEKELAHKVVKRALSDLKSGTNPGVLKVSDVSKSTKGEAVTLNFPSTPIDESNKALRTEAPGTKTVGTQSKPPVSLESLQKLLNFTPQSERNGKTAMEVYDYLRLHGITHMADGYNPFKRCS
jgi:hypothetical protein